jgi:ubiquinone/menaquinone biosynthesis C-methylase UbiE
MTSKQWKRYLGIESYKYDWYLKYFLYKFLGVKLPKLKNQHQYWENRGQVYMNEILSSGYLEYEVFFQDLLINELRQLEFDTFFEAGCGFGWNVRRVKEEFPGVRVGGLDFSSTQLLNAKTYLKGIEAEMRQGDICSMPFEDDHFDVGFSLGVFMNIHPDKIMAALREIARVAKKYVIHIEYDETHTTPGLREKRAFKTNIVSHDYRSLYQELGLKVRTFKTFEDFGSQFEAHACLVGKDVGRWEGLEGPGKYILIVVEVG